MARRGGSGAALARQPQPPNPRRAPAGPEAPRPLALPVPKALAPPRMPRAEVVRGWTAVGVSPPAGSGLQEDPPPGRPAGRCTAPEESSEDDQLPPRLVGESENQGGDEQDRWEGNWRARTPQDVERAATGNDRPGCHGWVGKEEGSRGLRPRHWQIHFYGCWSKMAVSAEGKSQCEPSTKVIRVR